MNFKFLVFVSLFVLLVGVVSAHEFSDNGTCMVKESACHSDSVSNEFIAKHDDRTNVKSASSKVKTRLTVDRIPNVSRDSSVFVSGSLCDVNGNGVDNARVTLDVNGEKYSATTYDGDYFGEYFVNQTGKHSVKVSFAGNGKYYASSASTSFNVSGKTGTYIYLDDVSDTRYGNLVSVSGFFSDNHGKYLKNSLLTVNVNGKKYTAKTDGYGYFVKKFKANKIGRNSVKVSYKGNSKYKYTSMSTSFNVSRQSTKITCNNLKTVNKGSAVKVSGRLVDANSNALKSVNVVVKVNGVKHVVKTNSNGYYSYSFKASKIGSNSVTVSFGGTKNYLAKSISKKFSVKSPYKTMTLYMSQDRYVGSDVFSAWYQSFSGEFSSGVYVMVINDIRGLDGPANNLIVGSTFYFKNSKGNVISRSFDAGNGIWMGHNLVKGYTPFKVLVKYRSMTAYETDMWNSGYEWNAKTNTWRYWG